MLPIKIAGVGACLPERVVGNAELERELGLPAGWVEQLTGVRARRRATHETTLGLAARAARAAFAHADVNPADTDLIIGASTGPAQLIPCTAALLQGELGLPDGRSTCFDVNATCVSFLVALQTAAHLLAAGGHRQALLFSSEIAGRTLDPREPESAALIGDAAAAAVLTRAGPGDSSAVHLTRFATHGSGATYTECRGGGTRHHPNDPATTPEHNLFHMNGPAIYKLAARLLGPFVDDFCAAVGWDRAGLDAVVPHQASGRGVGLLVRRCGIRPEQLVLNLAERGNCIAASLPLALAEAVHAGRIRRGHRVLLIGTGAGVTIGAAALTY